jgi:hypothetical protein
MCYLLADARFAEAAIAGRRNASMMRGTELEVLLVRLGFVVGIVLLGIVVFMPFHRSATTAAPSTSRSQATLPPPSVTTPALPSVTTSSAPPAHENVPRVDGALVETSGMMIPPPPDTLSALQSVDPRQLRAVFQRGTAAMQKYIDGEIADGSDNKPKIEGARLVNVAASLGFEPARAMIARDYPRSHIIRLAVPGNEAVRYSLDPLFSSGTPSDGNRALTLLAAYYSGHHELETFAISIMEALRDDRRLRTDDRIKFLLTQLAGVRGACGAIVRAISPARILTGAECPPTLQQQMHLFLEVAAPAGREAESRRQALSMLQSQQGFEHAAGQ